MLFKKHQVYSYFFTFTHKEEAWFIGKLTLWLSHGMNVMSN